MPRGKAILTAERVQARRVVIEAELAELKATETRLHEERALLIGRALLAHASADEAYRAELNTLLDRLIVAKTERKLIGLPERRARRGRKGGARNGGDAPASKVKPGASP